MAGSVNKVILIGNLGKDPESRSTRDGTKVVNFSLATTEQYTDQSGQAQKKTEWHKIVLWRKLADVAERFCRKGSSVYIEGKIRTRSWDDPSGQKRYSTEITADFLQLLDKKPQGEGGGGGDSFGDRGNFDAGPAPFAQPDSGPGAGAPADEDLPF